MIKETNNHTRIHLYLCPDMESDSGLSKADQINIYVHDTNAVALMRSMTVKELVTTIDELEFLLSSLTAKLLNKIFCEVDVNSCKTALHSDGLPADLYAWAGTEAPPKGKHERKKEEESKAEPDTEIPIFLSDLLRKFGLDPELFEIAILSDDVVET